MKKKITVMFLIMAVFFMFWLFDYYRSKQFLLEYQEISEQPSPADGITEILFSMKLTRNGKPVAGHDLYGVPYGAGGFKAYRVSTDENGVANFVYFPYIASSEEEVKDVPFKIIDENNSIFLEVNAYYDGVLRFKMPTEKKESIMSLDDIFDKSDKK